MVGLATAFVGSGCAFDGPEKREAPPSSEIRFAFPGNHAVNLGPIFDAISVDRLGNIEVIDGDYLDRADYSLVQEAGSLPTGQSAEVDNIISETVEQIGRDDRTETASSILFYAGDTVDYCSVYVTFKSKYEGVVDRVRDLPEGLCVDLAKVVFANARLMPNQAIETGPISR